MLNYFEGVEFELDAVDFVNEPKDKYYSDANSIRFRLNGTVYIAIEDPDDGYRSSLGELIIGDKITNTFKPNRVKGVYRELANSCDIIEFVDCITNKVVLEIGTDNTDTYYPFFVANFSPENMFINQTIEQQIKSVLSKKLA